MAAYNDQLLTKLHKAVITKVMGRAVNVLDPDLPIDLQKNWETSLGVMKDSHQVPAPVPAARQSGLGVAVSDTRVVTIHAKLPKPGCGLMPFSVPAHTLRAGALLDYRLDLDIPVDSGDDLSEDEEATTPFESDNKMFCRWTKMGRKGVGWIYKFANGIISVDGREFVFQKADGFSDWRDRNIYERMPIWDRDSNQIYRDTMLGLSLKQCLQELTQNGRMTLQQSEEVLTCYDEEMFVDFGMHGVKNKLTLNASNLIGLYGLHPDKDLTLRHTDVQVHSVERKLKVPLVSADKLTTVATKLARRA